MSIASAGRFARPLSLLPYFLLLLTLSLFFQESVPPVEQMDDAYISYRYAQNLADGHGLVFNIGERVEGYTNLLWTLMAAAGIKLGLPAPLAGHWLGVFSGALLLLATYLYARLLLPVRACWLAALAPMVLLASNSFACWTASGLESPLFAGFVILALCAYGRGAMGYTLLWTVLASLTRPEGVLLAGLLLGWNWLWRLWTERPSQVRSLLLVSLPALGFAAFLALLTAFRLYYYGDYLPNTFYAKVGGVPLSRGFGYLYNFAVDGPGLLLIPAVVALIKFPAYRISFVYLLLTAAYTVIVGGDVFRLGRFLLPVLPVLIVGASLGAYWVFNKQKVLGLLLGLTLPASALFALYSQWPFNMDFGAQPLPGEAFPASAKRLSARKHDFFLNEAVAQRQVQALEQLTPPVSSVAAIGIGEVGYFGKKLVILDLVGLTDRHIARSQRTVESAFIIPGHQRTDADYVLSRKPDVIIIPRQGSSQLFPLPAIIDLWSDPRLQAEYDWNDDLLLYVRKPELRAEQLGGLVKSHPL